MKKYVDTENVMNEIKRFVGYLDEDMILRINLKLGQLPAADVRPVVRGKWIKYEDTSLVYCNVCKHMNGSTMFMENRRDFCPNCGADMRGWADEQAIDNIPAADVVEVVRCKDCKWLNTEDCGNECDCPNGIAVGYVKDNDFCSYGERRER